MNTARFEHLKALFAWEGYSALLCRLPQYVLMFTGYQPILGNSFCLVSLNTAKEIEIRLAIPDDEQNLVPSGIAIEVKTFAEETMSYVGSLSRWQRWVLPQ